MAIKPETCLFAGESLDSTGSQVEGEEGEVAIQMVPHQLPEDSMSTASAYETPLGIVRDTMATPMAAPMSIST